MATMTDLSAVRTFVNACVRNIDGPWGNLVATIRVRNMHRAVLTAITPCNVPPPGLAMRGSLEGGALFDFSRWRIEVDPNSFGSDIKPDRDTIIELACTFYHETRHCEQWFHMARYAAVGHQMTAAKLARHMGGIPANVATAALRRPMRLGDPMLNLTKGWYKSVYGSGATQRDVTLGGLTLRRRGPAALMHAFRDGFFQNYQGGLAEEVDAWAIEQLVAQEYPRPRRPAPPPPRP